MCGGRGRAVRRQPVELDEAGAAPVGHPNLPACVGRRLVSKTGFAGSSPDAGATLFDNVLASSNGRTLVFQTGNARSTRVARTNTVCSLLGMRTLGYEPDQDSSSLSGSTKLAWPRG
jgi:hypothetical protein